jgi:hypothetical protein
MLSNKIYTTVTEIPEKDWNSVVAERNVYLSLPYLKALETAMSPKMGFYYALSFNEKKEAVLASSFQVVPFEDKRKAYTEELCLVANHISNISKKIMNVSNLNVLVCGDVFCNGENGFLWNNITPEQAIEGVQEVVAILKKKKEVKEKAAMTLFKEFWPTSTKYTDELKKFNYRELMLDVNMVLDIHPDWKTMEDYLQSMKTKFRTKAKSVFKKSDKLEMRSFSVEEIEGHKELITKLFGNVLAKSDFGYGTLTTEALINFKRELGDKFILQGFLLEGKLVGFSTSFLNGENMEATYVGMDYEFNEQYAVYQRMLYNYVRLAIDNGAKQLQLGRTSELLKSSLGALPTNMKLYVRHQKSFPNLLLKPIINSISPSKFELRKPFKADFSY